MKKQFNEHQVNELVLYSMNDRWCYDCLQYTCKNLARKQARGIYEEQKAFKAMYNLAVMYAKRYHRVFNMQEKWYKLFTVADRLEVAKHLLAYFKEEFE